MPLYVYKKAPIPTIQAPEPPVNAIAPTPTISTSVTNTQTPKSRFQLSPRLKRLAPATLITLGSLLIANVAWPILHYQLIISPRIQKDQLITPININQTAFIAPPSDSPGITTSPLTNQVLSQEIDYTKASN
ncbi:hypothetical protein ACFL2V_13675, partial [Pseudomonadota bacterium]